MTSEKKPVVLLIPGVGNNERLWTGQLAALGAGHEFVIANYVGAVSIEEMADRALAQLPPGPFSLVGFSLGGYIALNIVGRFPERVERLAFISSSPFADSEEISKQRQAIVKSAQKDYRGVLRSMSGFIVFAGGPNAEQARKTLFRMGEELGVDEFCRQQQATMERQDCSALLPTIRCPVRVLCGADDPVTPVSGNRYLVENIPGATLQVLEQTGHLLPLERPDEVNGFLRAWLLSGAAENSSAEVSGKA